MKKIWFSMGSLLAAVGLLMAGCGGGGSSSSASAPLAPGGTGVTLAPVTDPGAGGNATAAFSLAVAVNDDGQVVGYAETAANSEFRAAIWTVDAAGGATAIPTVLPPLAGHTFSAAFAIDANGQVVGESRSATAFSAVIWKTAAVATPLPPLVAGRGATAFGISPDGGLIVGEAEDVTFNRRAVLWVADAQGEFASAPTVLPVGTFTVGLVPSPFSSANDVARAGNDILIAGEVEDGAGVKHAVVWNSVGAAFAANNLSTVGEVSSVALDVNVDGQIVGEVETAPNVFAAAMWKFEDNTGTVVITPTILTANASAAAINDNGRIVGTAAAKATAWNVAGAQPVMTALFATPSQAYGNNNGDVTGYLVVGVNNGQGFVKKVN